jgi:hypothetical protein
MGFCPDSRPGRTAFFFASADAINQRALMRRCLLVVLLLGLFGGCAKPKDLPELTVRSTEAGELAAFKSELGARFTADQLKPLDTALQELQLDAMNRGVAAAEDREQTMLNAVNGKSVHEALVLGWQARRNRFLHEISLITGLLDGDMQLQQKTAATGTSQSVLDRIRTEQGLLAQLQANLAATERQLTDWGATIVPPATQKPHGQPEHRP